MFFRKKRRIEELEERVRNRDETICRLNENIEELKQKIRGDRICDYYCSACKYSYQHGFYYGCLLDCKCKDFSQND